MGQLIHGNWTTDSIITSDAQGSYQRKRRTFLSKIHREDAMFTPEKNRYHLYVSYACPWATRTLIYRHLKDLDTIISVDVVHPNMLDHGWTFDKDFPHCTGDRLHHQKALKDIYTKADPRITTSVTVPVLWDKKHLTIVNNESSDIIRMFNSAFDHITGNTLDLYPVAYQKDIDLWNDRVYHTVNNGVYQAGFATTQKAYTHAVTKLFDTLDAIDHHLQSNNYLVGNTLTEADIRLVPTLLRFDLVYFGHFKCNLKLIRDYKHIHTYMQRMLDIPAIKQSFFPDHIKQHYYYSHPFINPYHIVPIGPLSI